MKGKNNMVTVKKANRYRFFFIKPTVNSNINDVVEKLLRLRNIIEVLISEDDYGIIVRACQTEGDDSIHDYISKNFGGRFSEAVCHYKYRK
ncbi:MAG: hypothetical protein KGI00_04520 [Candidatus Micrarchaeota archaeon]|nr:hypothetical protein [Candidatus Micrarchaeota archaeon]MDE1849964.1 hypothetical protein [Candidatus Micrarchaeota archaeon]